MLTEICAEIHNWFCNSSDAVTGEFKIENGSIESLDFLQKNQYFRIVGSVFNDGVWCYGVDYNMTDETFTGKIYPMKVPKAVLDLDAEIEAWLASNIDVVNSPFQSESFGGYSYTKASNANGDSYATWQNQFASRLKPYKRLRDL